ncbi:MAG: hypothetical protein J6333_05060, partial [Planctomycetes bacterium]|nr:hypothetical protein [Planctomycetota bacterium]
FLTIEDCDPQTIYRVRATVTDERGGRVTQARYVGGFAEAKRVAAPVALDGKLDEPAWAQAKVMEIREKRQMFTFDAQKLDVLWNGPEDLSARWRALWDKENLYLAVEVTDDAHHVQFADGAIWNQDGLQFLFDPARLSAEKAGKYDYSVGLGTKGPQAWCHLTADANERTGEAIGISVAVADLPGSKGGKLYEIAIPWKRLAPFKPALGADLGMSLILNEDDGEGRFGFMGWFSGVHSKELDLVGDLVLTE